MVLGFSNLSFRLIAHSIISNLAFKNLKALYSSVIYFDLLSKARASSYLLSITKIEIELVHSSSN